MRVSVPSTAERKPKPVARIDPPHLRTNRTSANLLRTHRHARASRNAQRAEVGHTDVGSCRGVRRVGRTHLRRFASRRKARRSRGPERLDQAGVRRGGEEEQALCARWTATNRSSTRSSSGTHAPAASSRCWPGMPFSKDVTRGISPLMKTVFARTDCSLRGPASGSGRHSSSIVRNRCAVLQDPFF